MLYDPESQSIKLCAQGVELEGQGKSTEALQLFEQAWQEAVTSLEKLSAAHYIARHQKSVSDKLAWDETALRLALQIGTDDVKAIYSSLFLNIGKCYEDLQQFDLALANYLSALNYTAFLPDSGYGHMIGSGIQRGIKRVEKLINNFTSTK